MGGDLDILDDEQDLRPRIGRPTPPGTPLTLRGVPGGATVADDESPAFQVARPRPISAPSSNPALTLRGVPSGQTPPMGSSESLENSAAKIPAQMGTSLRNATQPDAPSPLQKQTTIDRAQQSNLDKGSGISQIASPVARNTLRGVNVLGSVAGAVFPQIHSVMRAIPGTEEHHQKLVGQNNQAIAGDEGQAKEQAVTQHEQAQTEAIPAETGLKEAQTNALNNPEPKPKDEKWSEFAGFTDNDGTPLMREENSGQVVRASDKKQPIGFKPSKPDAPFQTREITRVVNGVPHTVMVDAQTGADVKDEGQTKVPGESSADKRSAQESAQVERESRGAIRKAEEQYRGTLQSVSQLKSSIDAAKDGNGLLTSFVPTMEVLGINASAGVHRISPAEAHAAGVPGGWAEQFNAWYDKASTGQLSPQLQAEGKKLGEILAQSAYQRYQSIYNDEAGVVKGYGGTGFEQRVPLIPGGVQGSGTHGGQHIPGGKAPGLQEGQTGTGSDGKKYVVRNGAWASQ
jgi:hypothetical protein